MDDREQRQRATIGLLAIVLAIGAVAACVVAVANAVRSPDAGSDISLSPLHRAYPDAQLGDAFTGQGSGGFSMPIQAGDHAQLSAVLLFNETDQPIRVLAARPTWVSEPRLVTHLQLTPNGPGVMGSRTHVGTSAAPGPERLLGAPLSDGSVVPPTHGVLGGTVLSFDVSVPTADVGLVLGMDVVYERGGRRWLQRFPFVVVACPFPGKHQGEIDGPCGPYRSVDAFRMDFGDALKAVRKLS